jgi:hypothetical protein
MNTKCTYTATFAHFITREWRYQSLEELARKFHVSVSIVYDCLRDIDVRALQTAKIDFLDTLTSIILGVDEFSFQWRNYMLQITELRTKKVVGILTETSVKAITEWCNLLPLSVITKIEGIVSDMNASYKKTIQDCIRRRLKAAQIQWQNMADFSTGTAWNTIQELGIIDHFHLKQMMMKTMMEVHSLNNWMIKMGHYDTTTQDLFRKETKHFNKYRTVVPWSEENEENMQQATKYLLYTPKDPDYQAITLGHFLSCKYQSLLMMSEEKMTTKQQHRVNQILHEFDPRGYLKEAYLAKELFFEALDTKNTTLLSKVIEDMTTSMQYKIEICWKTLKKWKQSIINFFHINITNAFTEWKNTKIKLLKRMAYGYRIKTNFQKRLLLCL